MEEHKHDFKEYELKFVQSDSDQYTGTQKGLIIKKCDCGQDTALDYGEYADMKDKYLRLVGLVNVL